MSVIVIIIGFKYFKMLPSSINAKNFNCHVIQPLIFHSSNIVVVMNIDIMIDKATSEVST